MPLPLAESLLPSSTTSLPRTLPPSAISGSGAVSFGRRCARSRFDMTRTLIEDCLVNGRFVHPDCGSHPKTLGEVITLGGDKNYDTQSFVASCRAARITPHVSQNEHGHRSSAIDERTTRHEGYALSQRKRKRVEEIFGWIKTIAGLRKTKHRGRKRVGWMFTFAAAAFNLVRLRSLNALATA